MKVRSKLCTSCHDRLNKLFFVESVIGQDPCSARCQLCGFCGWIDTYEYDTSRLKKERGSQCT